MARVFLPVRRGAEVIVFEHYELKQQRRWDFRAVAASPTASQKLERTGIGTLDAAAMAECQSLVDRLPEFEAMLGAVSMMDIARIAGLLDTPSGAAVVEGSPLLTATVYAHFLRQSLVHETAVRRYEGQTPQDRVELGRSAALYNSLLRRFDLPRAAELLEADLPQVRDSAPGTDADWRYYLTQAATIKFRCKDPEAGEALLERAAHRAPNEEVLRRLGSARAERGALEPAVEAYLESNRHGPLPGPAALRLAKWLVTLGRAEEARVWATTAEARGVAAAQEVLQSLAD